MPAALGSTGEQKALLIGLILAHARLVRRRTGITPFLLLDEIAAHLDPDRRRALFAALDGLETQCFLTGTDPCCSRRWASGRSGSACAKAGSHASDQGRSFAHQKPLKSPFSLGFGAPSART